MGDRPDGFGTGEASRLSGVAMDSLDYWSKTGLLRPSLAPGQGKGARRRYSFTDIVALRVVRQLRDAGISLQSLRKVIEHLHARDVDTSFANTFLVSDGIDVFERRGDQLISTLRRPGQGSFAWIVDLDAVVDELRAAIAA